MRAKRTRTWGGFRETLKIKSKDKGKSWIPAFAGMTRLRGLREG